MIGQVSSSNIIDNDNFNGRASINLSNGQYLNLAKQQFLNQNSKKVTNV